MDDMNGEEFKFQPLSSQSSIDSKSTQSTVLADIFYIHNSETIEDTQAAKNGTISEVTADEKTNSSEQSRQSPYKKHTNLDVQPLTFREQVRMVRLFYITVPRSIHLFTIVFCLAWFIFNTVCVVKQYLEYNTIVVVDFQEPAFTRPPAVSFCTECSTCFFPHPSMRRVKDVLENDMIFIMSNGTVDDIENAIAEVRDIDIQINCTYTSDSITVGERKVYQSDCTNHAKRVVSMEAGRKCFIFFSDIYSQNASNLRMQFDYTPTISFSVGGQYLFAPKAALSVGVHSPYNLATMQDVLFLPLENGKFIDVRFGKMEMHLRPPPHRPECFVYRTNDPQDILPDYLDSQVFSSCESLIARDGTSIYRSRAECYMYCMWRRLANGSAINYLADFTSELATRVRFYRGYQLLHNTPRKAPWVPPMMFRWNHSFIRTTFDNFDHDSELWLNVGPNKTIDYNNYMDAKQDCLELCPQPCFVEEYPLVLVTTGVHKSDPVNSHVTVRWATKTVTSMVYKENMDFAEFLGTIGGHAHIWLGLSFIHIVLFLVKMIRAKQFLPAYGCCMFNWFYGRKAQSGTK